MARDVADAPLMLDAMAGPHPEDPLALPAPPEPFLAAALARRAPGPDRLERRPRDHAGRARGAGGLPGRDRAAGRGRRRGRRGPPRPLARRPRCSRRFAPPGSSPPWGRCYETDRERLKPEIVVEHRARPRAAARPSSARPSASAAGSRTPWRHSCASTRSWPARPRASPRSRSSSAGSPRSTASASRATSSGFGSPRRSRSPDARSSSIPCGFTGRRAPGRHPDRRAARGEAALLRAASAIEAVLGVAGRLPPPG